MIDRGEQGNCPDCNALGECTAECRDSSLQRAVDAYQARQNASKVLSQAVREARKQHSLAVIAQELGVSRQRVHQISQSTEEKS